MAWNTVSWDRAARRARLRVTLFGVATGALLLASGTAALADRNGAELHQVLIQHQR